MWWSTVLLLASAYLTVRLSTAEGKERLCDFPKISHGILYDAKKYDPLSPIPSGKVLYYSCEYNFVSPSNSFWNLITCTEEGWSPTPKCLRLCFFPFVENGDSTSSGLTHLQGDTVQVICNPGYRLQNNQSSIACTEEGWSIPPKCISTRKCGPPPSIDNGDITSFPLPEYPPLSSVEYQCKSFSKMQGNNKITCRNGEWSEPPKCLNPRKKCGPPPPIKNGDIISFRLQAYDPFSSVEYRCQSEYILQGDTKITCRNGEWSEPPKCLKKKSCPPPPRISNAQVMEITVKNWDGEKVSLLCQDNYLIHDTEEMVCKNGTWQSLPLCIVKSPCSQPPEIDHGKIKLPRSPEERGDTAESRSYGHGTTLSYVCDDGFRMVEEHGVTCHLGKWSAPPRCVGLPCGPPPSIRHGIVSNELDSYQHGAEVTYICSEGFGIDGPAFIKCIGGKWPHPPDCKRTYCDSPPEFENAILTGQTKRSYRPGERVTFKCAPFYHMNGSNTVTCVNRTWIGKLVCKDNSCGNPPHVGNATIVTRAMTKYPSGERVRYECNRPFQLVGEVEVRCKNGIWTEPPKCKDPRKKCGPPPPIKNGDIISFRLQTYDPFSSVEYRCQSEYILQGDTKITCRNGEWSEPPKCLNPCVVSKEIMEKHNIILKWKENQKLYVPSSDLVEFRCKPGYQKASTSPPLRTMCIDGHINYPLCVKNALG